MKNLISLGVFLLILLSVQVNAQEQSVLKIRPTGRILMDGGLFHSDNKNFVDGVAIPDARIGVKATDRKSTRLNSSHTPQSRMPSSA